MNFFKSKSRQVTFFHQTFDEKDFVEDKHHTLRYQGKDSGIFLRSPTNLAISSGAEKDLMVVKAYCYFIATRPGTREIKWLFHLDCTDKMVQSVNAYFAYMLPTQNCQWEMEDFPREIDQIHRAYIK